MLIYIIILILFVLLAVQYMHCRRLKQKIAILENQNIPPKKQQDIAPLPEHEDSNMEVTTENNEKPGRYKLLVIEDHKDIQLYLKVLFGKEYNLHIATNGEEGLKKAQEIIPDLIITDIMMPVMNGFECTRILKEKLETCHIPIIQLTALSDENNTIKGMELGADDYIVKPFNPEVLKTKVKRLIKSRQDLKTFYTQLLLPQAQETIDNNTNEEKKWKELETQDPFISKVFQLVNLNIQNKNLSAKNLADILNISLPTLYRKTKQSTGFTVAEIIRATRMKKASELLKEHNRTINEIAETIGYNDLYTFRKHFVEFYGIKPSEFYRGEDTDENNHAC